MIKEITEKEFKDNIFDFDVLSPQNIEWFFKGNKNTIMDFYADWCQPCKRLAPILELASDERTDIDFLKINVENAQNVSSFFGIRSIPTVMFIPRDKTPETIVGVVSKSQINELINEIFNK